MSGTVSPLTSLWDIGVALLSSSRLVEVNCFIFPCYQAGVKVVIEPAQPFFKAKALFTIPADAKDTHPCSYLWLELIIQINPSSGQGEPIEVTSSLWGGHNHICPSPQRRGNVHIFTQFSLALHFQANLCGSVFSPSEHSFMSSFHLGKMQTPKPLPWSLVTHFKSVLELVKVMNTTQWGKML